MLFAKVIPVTRRYLINRTRKLLVGWSETGGRNSHGRITSFKVGAFKFKRLYRFIDFWRRLKSDAFVIKFEQDAFRTATISLLFYQTGFLTYTLLPDGFFVGDKLQFTYFDSSKNFNFLGNSLPLSRVAEGAFVFNIEMWPLKGGQLCRSAGSYGIVLSKRDNFVTLKMRSGWKLILSGDCYATLGIAPNYKHIYRVIKKAGTRRNLGRRPTVRGVAMNPIDHPHGGGRGKTSGGPKPRSPWGSITKQRKTVLKKIRLLKQSVRYR